MSKTFLLATICAAFVFATAQDELLDGPRDDVLDGPVDDPLENAMGKDDTVDEPRDERHGPHGRHRRRQG